MPGQTCRTPRGSSRGRDSPRSIGRRQSGSHAHGPQRSRPTKPRRLNPTTRPQGPDGSTDLESRSTTSCLQRSRATDRRRRRPSMPPAPYKIIVRVRGLGRAFLYLSIYLGVWGGCVHRALVCFRIEIRNMAAVKGQFRIELTPNALAKESFARGSHSVPLSLAASLDSGAAQRKVRQLPRRWLSFALAPASLFNAAVAVFLDCLVSASHACVGMTPRGRCPLTSCWCGARR